MALPGKQALNSSDSSSVAIKPSEQRVSFELQSRSSSSGSQTDLDMLLSSRGCVGSNLCTHKECNNCENFCSDKHVLQLELSENTCYPILCKLCLSEYLSSDIYTLKVCHCKFCVECMRQYSQVLIAEGTVTITCPDADCPRNGILTELEIKYLVDETAFARYQKLKFEREVELDPQRTFCPQPGCDTVCNINNQIVVGDQSFSQKVSCPTCGLNFCAMCKAKWHGDMTCDEIMRSGKQEDEGIPFSSPVDAPIKRCPVCHLPIERNDGCAQMMCKRCKHVFCWYCMASLDNDFLLRHYDKGPCKNKLGHSRASVIWHRTQVIGIFAGFGLLLLVASPFLLLAAPCILCCKCKKCRCHDEEEDNDVATTT